MDGEMARIAIVAGSTAGALGVYGVILKSIWNRQNKDHDCIIGMKKDTEYIREKMDAVIGVLDSMNGKKVI